jgi:hypothetical protein
VGLDGNTSGSPVERRMAAFHYGGLESLFYNFYIHGVEEATKYEDLLAKKRLFYP